MFYLIVAEGEEDYFMTETTTTGIPPVSMTTSNPSSTFQPDEPGPVSKFDLLHVY